MRRDCEKRPKARGRSFAIPPVYHWTSPYQPRRADANCSGDKRSGRLGVSLRGMGRGLPQIALDVSQALPDLP